MLKINVNIYIQIIVFNLLYIKNSYSIIREVWVFIQDIVEICYLPTKLGLVRQVHDFEKIDPSNLCLKSHHILNNLTVCASEENFRKILILDIQLHG